MMVIHNPEPYNLTPFELIVQSDVRNQATTEQSHIVRLPENNQEWQDALVAFLNRIDVQLSISKAERARKNAEYRLAYTKTETDTQADKIQQEYDKYIVDKLAWRASIIGLRKLVEGKLAEAKRLSKEIDNIEVIKIKTAVQHHKEVVGKGMQDDEIAEVDRVLWIILGESQT